MVAQMLAAGPVRSVQAQESAPRAAEVEKQSAVARETGPIAADKKPNVVFILASTSSTAFLRHLVGFGDLCRHNHADALYERTGDLIFSH